MTDGIARTDGAEGAVAALTQLFDYLEGAAAVLPSEDAAAIQNALQFGREQVATLRQMTQRQMEIVARTMAVSMKLQEQRDRHARRYADLVEAMETGDERHPLVGMLFETYMNTDSNIIDQLERALGDADAASTVADLALGRGTVEPEALDYVIDVLAALRERKAAS